MIGKYWKINGKKRTLLVSLFDICFPTWGLLLLRYSQIWRKMEKYEFRTRCPWWLWLMVGFTVSGSFILLMMKERYDLVVTCGIIWIPYLAILLISHSRTYTVTPESFTVTTKLLKPRSIPLLNIIGLEKTYIRNNRPKSLVIRYRTKDMYRSFLAINRNEVDIEGVLEAVLAFNHLYRSVNQDE